MSTTSSPGASNADNTFGSQDVQSAHRKPLGAIDELVMVIKTLGLPVKDTIDALLTEMGNGAKYDDLRSRITPENLERAIEGEKTMRVVEPTAQLLLYILGDVGGEVDGAKADEAMLGDELETITQIRDAWNQTNLDLFVVRRNIALLLDEVHAMHKLPIAITTGAFPAAKASSNATTRMKDLFITGKKLADLVRDLLQRRQALIARGKTLHSNELRRINAKINMKATMTSLARLKEFAAVVETLGVAPEGSSTEHAEVVKERIRHLLDAQQILASSVKLWMTGNL